MSKITNVSYFENALDVSSICEVNRSFDKGVLRIAYHGQNRNGTNISKEAFEAALPSLANVPVVTHYLRQQDDLGGHDMELVTGDDGRDYLVYVTEPVGVVPSSPNCWWEEIEDVSGLHEYLCVDVLLWKRQEAYKNIKKSGVVGQSMEITINDGEDIDGVYHVHSFIFTALCLLGDKHEPCFESASLSVFGLSAFQAQYQEMLKEFKLEFAQAGGTIPEQEGGDKPMNTEIEVEVVETEEVETVEVVKPEVVVEVEPVSVDEPNEETTEIIEETAPSIEDSSEGSGGDSVDGSSNEGDSGDGSTADFSLTVMAQLEEINRMVCEAETIVDSLGYEYSRYLMVDVQADEVIVYDAKRNWNLYGATITETGDKLSIDFENMKRKKVSYEDFMETAPENNWLSSTFSALYSSVSEAIAARNEVQDQYNTLNGKYAILFEAEQARLEAEHKAAIAEVFEKFEKLLGGDAEFEAMKGEAHEDVVALENACYSLYGKKKAVFTVADNKKQKNISLNIGARSEDSAVAEKPYGELFAWKNDNK